MVFGYSAYFTAAKLVNNMRIRVEKLSRNVEKLYCLLLMSKKKTTFVVGFLRAHVMMRTSAE